jgi:hypothetical protein
VTEMPTDPGLNLQFVDEALNLVRDAEARGIRLRILGSIAYRLQCPNNLHFFEDMVTSARLRFVCGACTTPGKPSPMVRDYRAKFPMHGLCVSKMRRIGYPTIRPRSSRTS